MYKVLLDENLPVKIKYCLQDSCEIYTVSDKNWNSFENGNLIRAMEKDGFDFLITSDKNLSVSTKHCKLSYKLYNFRYT
jgi:hypothetical protein